MGMGRAALGVKRSGRQVAIHGFVWVLAFGWVWFLESVAGRAKTFRTLQDVVLV